MNDEAVLTSSDGAGSSIAVDSDRATANAIGSSSGGGKAAKNGAAAAASKPVKVIDPEQQKILQAERMAKLLIEVQ